MRTLKKTLCLVLCLAMVIGMFAISASAAEFPDAEDVENKEEMGLVVGLGIIKGTDDDGDGEADRLNPTGTLTRAEAAVIIYRLLTGKVDAEPAAAKTGFADVDAGGYAWASGAIAFCADKGIIVGYGDGNYGPADKLTGAQWGKMLLCALGYDAEKEELVGKGWDLNVTKWVKRTGMADAAEFGSGTDEISRDFACKMAFNALTIPMVEYEGGTHVETTDGTKVDVDEIRGLSGDFLCENFGMKTTGLNGARVDRNGKNESRRQFDNNCFVKGVVTANSYNAKDATSTYINGVKQVVETDEDLFGRYVIAYKDVKGNVLSICEIGSTLPVEEDLAKAADVKAAFGDVTKIPYGASVVKFDETGDHTAVTADKKNDYAIAADTAAAGVYVYDDEGNMVAQLLDSYEIVTLEKVSDVNLEAKKDNYQFASGLKFDTAALRTELTLAKDDVVLVKNVGELYYVTEAETVTGSITKYDTATKDITLDGKVYADYAKFVEDVQDVVDGVPANEDLTAPADITAGDMKKNTYTLYTWTDKYGNEFYLRCEQETGEKEVQVVYYVVEITSDKKADLDTGDIMTKYYATLVSETGEKSTVVIGKLADKEDAKLVGKDACADKLVTIKEDSKNKLTVLSGFVDDPNGVYSKNVTAQTFKASQNYVTIQGTDKKGYVNSDTKFIFITAEGVEVKTGAIGYELANAAKALVKDDNATDKNMMVQSVFIEAAYKAKIEVIDPSTLIYVIGKETATNTPDGLVYTVYNCEKGAKQDITVADPLSKTVGFYTYDAKTGVYRIDNDTDPTTPLVYDATYSSKVGTSIRIDKAVADFKYDAGDDIDATNAIIIDTRANPEKAITKVSELTNAVKLDMLFDKNGAITIIFVK